jgi:hypothetical protein
MTSGFRALAFGLMLLSVSHAASGRESVPSDRYFIRGEITSSTQAALTEWIDSRELLSPGVPGFVVLESQGGDAFAAMEMGRALRAGGVATLVQADCVSACVYVFLGGGCRFVLGRGRLGLHALSLAPRRVDQGFEDGRGLLFAGSVMLKTYFEKLGFSSSLYELNMSTNLSDVRWLTRSEMGVLGVLSNPNDAVCARLRAHDRVRG